MFSGLAMLALMLVFEVVYASIMPLGISQEVWVVTQVGAVTVYGEGEGGGFGDGGVEGCDDWVG